MDPRNKAKSEASVIERLSRNCLVLAGYLVDQGVELPQATTGVLEKIDPKGGGAGGKSGQATLAELNETLAALSKTAQDFTETRGEKKQGPTPISILITRPHEGRMRIIRSFFSPPILGALFLLAVISFLVFVASLPPEIISLLTGGADRPVVAITPYWIWMLHFTAAAALGASFICLVKLQGYIRDRMYDPSYRSHYVTRWLIGTIAGVVLAITVRTSFDSDNEVAQIGSTTLALLGGYSADGVRELLDRLVELLKTAVAGREEKP